MSGVRALCASGLLALLAACAPTTTGSAPASAPATPRAAPPPQAPRPAPSSGAFRPARVMSLPGLEAVIGKPAAALTALFGPPALTVPEGDAVKLQFRGQACVLDVYLYPPAPGAAPLASYVDARRASDSLDVDRAACVGALRR